MQAAPAVVAAPAAADAVPHAPAVVGAPPGAAPPVLDVNEEEKARKGRKGGACNYTKPELDSMYTYKCMGSHMQTELAEILEEILPLGAASWQQIAEAYKLWAQVHNYAVRDVDALRAKWMKMIKGKSTGVGGYSPLQLRYRTIELRAHNVAGGAVLADDEDDLDANAHDDIIDEADGIENHRTQHIFYTLSHITGSAARGQQTLTRLTQAVCVDADSPRPRQRGKLADTLNVLAANQQAALALEKQRLEHVAAAEKAEREADREERRQDREERNAMMALLLRVLSAAPLAAQPKQ